MDFFDKIAEELNKIKTHISKENKGFSFKRDFHSLSHKAKEMYKNISQNATILDKLNCVFDVFFDKKMNRLNSLPFSIPENEYGSEKRKEELEAEFNFSILINVSFDVLYESGLIKPEIREKVELKKMAEQIKNDFLTDFRNNGHKIQPKMIFKHFAKLV